MKINRRVAVAAAGFIASVAMAVGVAATQAPSTSHVSAEDSTWVVVDSTATPSSESVAGVPTATAMDSTW